MSGSASVGANTSQGEAISRSGLSTAPVSSSGHHVALAWSGREKSRLLPKAQFFDHARREQLRAIRIESEVALIIVSIDGPGKPVSEDLYELSKLLQMYVREADLLGWYAENAVAILLPDTDEQSARECVERIHAHMAPFTLSFRVVAYHKSPSFLGGRRRVVRRGNFVPQRGRHSTRSRGITKRPQWIWGSCSRRLW